MDRGEVLNTDSQYKAMLCRQTLFKLPERNFVFSGRFSKDTKYVRLDLGNH